MSNADALSQSFNSSLLGFEAPLSNIVVFWIYLILFIPSFICTVFSLYYLFRKHTLRLALHNHPIIVFMFISLICQVTIYPWMLNFYYRDGIWNRTPLFCSIWTFIDWGASFTQIMLFAWATIERYILVFHDQWVATKKKRLLVHYLPVAMITVYCVIYYGLLTFYPYCPNNFNDKYLICIRPCWFMSISWYIYDVVAHQLVPVIIIIGFTIGLVIRIIIKKPEIGLSLKFRKNWRMTVELLYIETICLVFALPLTIMNVLQTFGVNSDAIIKWTQYELFLYYCSGLVGPIAFTLLLPQLRNNRIELLHFLSRARAIVPIM